MTHLLHPALKKIYGHLDGMIIYITLYKLYKDNYYNPKKISKNSLKLLFHLILKELENLLKLNFYPYGYDHIWNDWNIYLTQFGIICDLSYNNENIESVISRIKNNKNENTNNSLFQRNLIIDIFKKFAPIFLKNIEPLFERLTV